MTHAKPIHILPDHLDLKEIKQSPWMDENKWNT